MRRIFSGAKHVLICEFISLQAGATYFVDTVDTGKWSRRAVENLVHAPHSLGIDHRPVGSRFCNSERGRSRECSVARPSTN